jgi:hypothetical protein
MCAGRAKANRSVHLLGLNRPPFLGGSEGKHNFSLTLTHDQPAGQRNLAAVVLPQADNRLEGCSFDGTLWARANRSVHLLGLNRPSFLGGSEGKHNFSLTLTHDQPAGQRNLAAVRFSQGDRILPVLLNFQNHPIRQVDRRTVVKTRGRCATGLLSETKQDSQDVE